MDYQITTLNRRFCSRHSATLAIAMMVTMVMVVGVVLKLGKVTGQIVGAGLEQVHD